MNCQLFTNKIVFHKLVKFTSKYLIILPMNKKRLSLNPAKNKFLFLKLIIIIYYLIFSIILMEIKKKF